MLNILLIITKSVQYFLRLALLSILPTSRYRNGYFIPFLKKTHYILPFGSNDNINWSSIHYRTLNLSWLGLVCVRMLLTMQLCFVSVTQSVGTRHHIFSREFSRTLSCPNLSTAIAAALAYIGSSEVQVLGHNGHWSRCTTSSLYLYIRTHVRPSRDEYKCL